MDQVPEHDDPTTERRLRLYRLRAIILRRRDLGEADRIVTVFSAERGKCRFVARGSRRPSSKLAGHLEPFGAARLLVARTRGLDIISQAETYSSFPKLRASEQTIATAGYLAELVDVLLPEEQANEPVFELLHAAYDLLDRGHDPGAVSHVFEMGLLRQVGYRPELSVCVSCQSPIEPTENGFDLEGGVICASCLALRPDVQRISVNALKVLRAIDRGDIERLLAIRVPDSVWREVSDILTRYITRIHGRELSSQRVMSELRLE